MILIFQPESGLNNTINALQLEGKSVMRHMESILKSSK
jgi:hypothetical protein